MECFCLFLLNCISGKHIADQESGTEFTPVPKHIDLAAAFVVKEYRKIRNDHTFSYGNKFYLIESPLRDSIVKQKIEIRTNQEAGFTVHFAGRELSVSEVKEPTKHSMIDMEIQKKLDVLELAESLGNVSEAAKISGVSRDTIYRHRRLVREGGIRHLKSKLTQISATRTVQMKASPTPLSSSP